MDDNLRKKQMSQLLHIDLMESTIVIALNHQISQQISLGLIAYSWQAVDKQHKPLTCHGCPIPNPHSLLQVRIII